MANGGLFLFSSPLPLLSLSSFDFYFFHHRFPKTSSFFFFGNLTGWRNSCIGNVRHIRSIRRRRSEFPFFVNLGRSRGVIVNYFGRYNGFGLCFRWEWSSGRDGRIERCGMPPCGICTRCLYLFIYYYTYIYLFGCGLSYLTLVGGSSGAKRAHLWCLCGCSLTIGRERVRSSLTTFSRSSTPFRPSRSSRTGSSTRVLYRASALVP